MLDVCEEYDREFRNLEREYEVLPSKNSQRRSLYAQSELLILKIQATLEDEQYEEKKKKELAALVSKLEGLSSKIKLRQSSMGRNLIFVLISTIDATLRLLGTWAFLIISSSFVALPCVLFLPVDHLLLHFKLIPPTQQLSIYGKKFIAGWMMRLSGVEVIVEGLTQSTFGNECSIVCFSHASSMDAFLTTISIPVRHYTLAKSDLFLIPFFSWCLLAFGGVPVVRSNRSQAIGALEEAAVWAKGGQCVAIAPEGTRSKSGQISAFKKGAFHLWEQLQAPIVPMVIFGAFDLFPPGQQICQPGRVYVRFLPPIQSKEGENREAMSRLVRKKMLEAWKDGPEDAGAELSWLKRVESTLLLFSLFALIVGVVMKFPLHSILSRYNLSVHQGIGVFLAGSVGITLVFYLYLMFISPLVTSLMKGRKSKENE